MIHGEQDPVLKTNHELERSLLGGALSMEFSDCSIAAADLSKEANELMQGAFVNGKSLRWIEYKYIVGNSELSQQIVCQDLEAKDSQHRLNLHGRSTSLVVAQSINIVEDPNAKTILKSFRKLIPRKTEAKSTIHVLDGDPMLAIKVGSDTLLPIASFARRKNGQCSYVQLGEEMYDDNFYVTTADDGSSRHGLIEAMRSVIKGFSHENKSERKPAYDVIQEFLNQQVDLRHESLAQAHEKQLVRKIFAKLKLKGPDWERRDLTIVDGSGSSAPRSHDTATIIPKTILADNRQVALVAAHPSTDKDAARRVDIFAETRTGLATQIATISRDFSRLEYADDLKLSTKQHQQVVRELLFALIARPQVKDIETPEKTDYVRSSLGEMAQQIARYCYEAGLLHEHEQYRDQWGSGDGGVALEREVRQRLNNFFDYPDKDYNPYEGEAPLDLALSRLEKLEASDRRIFSTLKVGERFNSLLGEVRKCDEVLMRRIARLALVHTGYQSEFENEQIGKTKASAVVAAKILVHDGIHQLTISGRPASMPDEDLKPLISVELDQTKPYLGQENNIENGFIESNVNEIIGILSRLSVAHKS